MEIDRYYSANTYLQQRFGEKVYKLALRGGHTCPNRDGTVGYGGCIFCGEGSGAFAAESIDEAIARLAQKQSGRRYIAYFQSYTVTHRMTEELKERIFQAARDERIVVLALGTRPDCLQPEILDWLDRLNRVKPVWVELGLQTIHEETAELINRGYRLPVFEHAVEQLRRVGIEVIVHLILGLPGESRDDMLQSVKYLNGLDIQGVKLQLLHILKGTRLGELYESGRLFWNNEEPGEMRETDRWQLVRNNGEPGEMRETDRCPLFRYNGEPGGMRETDRCPWNSIREEYPFTLPEYADLVCLCLQQLRRDIVVHRLTGDAPKKDLLAPWWSADKKRVLNTLRRRMEELDIRQGEERLHP